MKRYINIQTSHGVETVDEFYYNTTEEITEFKRCLREYQLSDSSNEYYPSRRCTKEWREN